MRVESRRRVDPTGVGLGVERVEQLPVNSSRERVPRRRHSRGRGSALSLALLASVALHTGALAVLVLDPPRILSAPAEITVVELTDWPALGTSPGREAMSAGPPGPETQQPLGVVSLDMAARPAAIPDAGPDTGVQTQFGSLETDETTASRIEALEREKTDLADRLAVEKHRANDLEQELRAVSQARDAGMTEMREAYERLVASLKQEIAEQEVSLGESRGLLSVSIGDRVLFPSGEASLTLDGRQVLDKVAAALSGIEDRRILIEGHTDDVPIGRWLRARFESNWELSTSRATEVVKYLTRLLPPERLSAAGRADTDPVATNATEEGRRRNRRIEIILLPVEDAQRGHAGS